MTTVIDLLRHGEPIGGTGKYRGQSDDPLSPVGWLQLRERAASEGCPWDYVVTSPLRRCAAFAEELSEQRGLPLVLDRRWTELGCGIWEGRSKADIETRYPGAIARFMADPEHAAPPGAEPLTEFHTRVAGALAELPLNHPNRHGLVVCHAGTIRAALIAAYRRPLADMFGFDIPLASLTRLVVLSHEPVVWQVMRHDSQSGNAAVIGT